ncbi:MAG: mechanosensitive ion channel [Fimbriimonadaceae bacterium]|nr:mechanosensitive ion channel [Fimbriimonadaceae bacterium]
MTGPGRALWILLAVVAGQPTRSAADPLLERTQPPPGGSLPSAAGALPGDAPAATVADSPASARPPAAPGPATAPAALPAWGAVAADEPRLNAAWPASWWQRQPSLTTATRRLWTDGELARWVARLAASDDPLGAALAWGLLAALLLGALVQWTVQRGWPLAAGEMLRQRVAVALAASARRHSGAAAGLLALAWAVQPGELLPASSRAPLVVVEACFGWLAVRWLLQAGLSPGPPAAPLLGCAPHLARPLARRASLLLAVLLGAALVQRLQQPLEIPADLVWSLRAAAGTLVLGIWWSLDRLLAPDWPAGLTAWRRLPRWLLLLALLAEAAGWRPLAAQLLLAPLGGLLWLPLLGLLRRLGEEVLDQLDRGVAGWAQAWRSGLGVAADQRWPGSSWLHLALQVSLWLGGGLGFLRLLLPSPAYQSVLTRAEAGWRVGNLPLAPLKLALGLLVLALLLAAAGWLRAFLEQRWRAHGRWDAAALEAALTVSSHAAQLVAVTIALAVAGLDLTKLTVVVGALSVGLGFGLQNIVNNLMAGLILLFERRIRIGDRIKVGDAEGVVAALAVRSTELRLADGTRVILPNSDLITKPVLNYGEPPAEPAGEALEEGGE